MPVLIFIRANLLQKRLKFYRNSLSWQNWQLTPSTKPVSRTRPSQKLVSHPEAVVIFNGLTRSERWLHLLVLLVVPVETFDWGKYICSNNTVGAPVSCFKHVSKTWIRRWFMISSFYFWISSLSFPCSSGPYGDLLGGHRRRSEDWSAQLWHKPLYKGLLDCRNYKASRWVYQENIKIN